MPKTLRVTCLKFGLISLQLTTEKRQVRFLFWNWNNKDNLKRGMWPIYDIQCCHPCIFTFKYHYRNSIECVGNFFPPLVQNILQIKISNINIGGSGSRAFPIPTIVPWAQSKRSSFVKLDFFSTRFIYLIVLYEVWKINVLLL